MKEQEVAQRERDRTGQERAQQERIRVEQECERQCIEQEKAQQECVCLELEEAQCERQRIEQEKAQWEHVRLELEEAQRERQRIEQEKAQRERVRLELEIAQREHQRIQQEKAQREREERLPATYQQGAGFDHQETEHIDEMMDVDPKHIVIPRHHQTWGQHSQAKHTPNPQNPRGGLSGHLHMLCGSTGPPGQIPADVHGMRSQSSDLSESSTMIQAILDSIGALQVDMDQVKKAIKQQLPNPPRAEAFGKRTCKTRPKKGKIVIVDKSIDDDGDEVEYALENRKIFTVSSHQIIERRRMLIQ